MEIEPFVYHNVKRVKLGKRLKRKLLTFHLHFRCLRDLVLSSGQILQERQKITLFYAYNVYINSTSVIFMKTF